MSPAQIHEKREATRLGWPLLRYCEVAISPASFVIRNLLFI